MNWPRFFLDQGRIDEGLANDQALAVHRAVGNRRAEGAELGRRGELLARKGRMDEAREALRIGEALLRTVGDQLGLAVLFCNWGMPRSRGATSAPHAPLLPQPKQWRRGWALDPIPKSAAG